VLPPAKTASYPVVSPPYRFDKDFLAELASQSNRQIAEDF